MRCRACTNEFEQKRNEVYCSSLCRNIFVLPFRCWDGEGITINEYTHNFTVLATNDSHIVRHPDGISTLQAIQFLTLKREPCINIWYSFDYDVNCILKDVPLAKLKELALTNAAEWRGWKIKYVPGKIFSVYRGSKRFTSYDVFGFFQKSFIKACADFGLDASGIEEGKADRANFASWPVERVLAYNQLELDLLLQLMNMQRQRLKHHAPAKQWYGPGAVATQWLNNYCKIKTKHHKTWPDEMEEAIRHAYFGGRIDVAEIGEFKECYAYDIASAYPFAMTHVPLVSGWEKGEIEENDEFALYHVEWKVPSTSRWCPFPWRSNKGSILYPPRGEGWYFGCELFPAERLFPQGILRLECWRPIRAGNHYPLKRQIEEAYDLRQVLKAKGDPSELAYKLILNSIYGKFAQKGTSATRSPRFQNYVWAAFTTAYTRGMILNVLSKHGDSIIALATDSIFSRSPILPKTESKKLGEWQYEGNYPTLILMPGVYARIKDDETEKYRQRGFPLPLNYGYVLRKWGCNTNYNTSGENGDSVTFTKFVGFRQAIVNGYDHWGFFTKEKKDFHDVSMFGFSKRFPSPFDIWEETWTTKRMLCTPSPKSEPFSHQYEVPTFEEEVGRELVDFEFDYS